MAKGKLTHPLLGCRGVLIAGVFCARHRGLKIYGWRLRVVWRSPLAPPVVPNYHHHHHHHHQTLGSGFLCSPLSSKASYALKKLHGFASRSRIARALW